MPDTSLGMDCLKLVNDNDEAKKCVSRILWKARVHRCFVGRWQQGGSRVGEPAAARRSILEYGRIRWDWVFCSSSFFLRSCSCSSAGFDIRDSWLPEVIWSTKHLVLRYRLWFLRKIKTHPVNVICKLSKSNSLKGNQIAGQDGKLLLFRGNRPNG